jgi:Tfp pilus assembly protein PilF
MRVICLLLAAAVLLSACESAPFKQIQQDFQSLFETGKGEPDLAAGIRSYENANYGESARQLQSALDQGLSKSSQLQAHKYLAFIHCVSDRQAQCRNEFRKALTLDPDFELEPAEAGHPIWGPVFLKEKTRRGG